MRVNRQRLNINSVRFSACGGSRIVASNLTSNYVFKPTPEQALGTDRTQRPARLIAALGIKGGCRTSCGIPSPFDLSQDAAVQIVKYRNLC